MILGFSISKFHFSLSLSPVWPGISNADPSSSKTLPYFAEAMRIILEHQNHVDCSQVKYLVAFSGTAGFGANVCEQWAVNWRNQLEVAFMPGTHRRRRSCSCNASGPRLHPRVRLTHLLTSPFELLLVSRLQRRRAPVPGLDGGARPLPQRQPRVLLRAVVPLHAGRRHRPPRLGARLDTEHRSHAGLRRLQLQLHGSDWAHIRTRRAPPQHVYTSRLSGMYRPPRLITHDVGAARAARAHQTIHPPQFQFQSTCSLTQS